MQHSNKIGDVIVTGGAGFIGSHLTRELINRGAHVTIIDTATELPELLKPVADNINFIHADITDHAAMLKQTAGHDAIFHCAAMAAVAPSVENPLLCMHLNITGTAVMLEAARMNNIKRFIFSSSAAVYGNYAVPCREDMPCNPSSPYGYSKLHGELLCQEYYRLYGITTVALRYFNVFSPTMCSEESGAPVYARFRHSIMHNQPITLHGAGQQTRDFVHVDDVVQANIVCATAPINFLAQHNLVGQALNVGSGKSISLLELFANLKKEFPHYNQEPRYLPARPGDINFSAADCTKLDSLRTKDMLY